MFASLVVGEKVTVTVGEAADLLSSQVKSPLFI